jgi:hypothetical protein
VKHSSSGAGDLRAYDIRLLLFRFFGLQREQQLDLFSTQDRGKASSTADDDITGLFDAGLPYHLETKLGLIRRDRPRVVQRAILVACLGWGALLVLSAAQSILFHNGSLLSFVADYGALGRSLVAAPTLVLAELVTAPRLSAIARHFQNAGLITPKDLPQFRDAVRSTYRLRDSASLEVAVFVIAFATTAILVLSIPPRFFPHWHVMADSGALTLSAAGWWNALISTPLLVLLSLGWLWRLLLWTRFLWLMTRLDLRLVSAHPDRAAGLGFLGLSLQPLSVVAFALGSIVAGGVANRVLHDHLPLMDFRYAVPVFLAFVVLLLIGPLLILSGKLFDARRRGVFEYGSFARSLGQQMEKRWLNHAAMPESLDANDFSATTDLYAIASNVYAMNLVPINLQNLAALAIGALLPFVPVVLASMSPEELLQKLTGLLL